MASEEDYITIENNYKDINDALQILFKKLYVKLRKNNANPSLNDFKSLIKSIKQIPANEKYYYASTEPEDDAVLAFNDIENVSYGEYNLWLAEKINFYMRLMGYYLALKGVPIDAINNALTLEERIDLIDQIDRLFLVVFAVDVPSKNYFEEYIDINYDIVDINTNEKVEDGIIDVYYGEDNVIKINVGEPLRFKPINTGENGFQTYQFVFSKSNKYKATRVTKKIKVININTIDRVFLDSDKDIYLNEYNDYILPFDYITGDTSETVNILIGIEDMENGDIALKCSEYDGVDLDMLPEGVVSIEMKKDTNWNPYLEFVTIQEDNATNSSL